MCEGGSELFRRVVQRQDAGGIQPADGWPWGLGEIGGSLSAMERRTFLHGSVPVEREGSGSGEWEP